MSIFSLIVAVALLVILCFKGVHSFPASILCALLIILLNQMDPWESMSVVFTEGFLSFFRNYLFVMTLGALLGALMSASGSAKSFALKLLTLFGEKRILLVIIVTMWVFVFVGINLFICIYVIYPIAVVIGKRQNISKEILFAAVMCSGIMTPFPGSITINNIIASNYLGTTLTAAPITGIVGSIVTTVLSLWYVAFVQKRYAQRGIGFEPGPDDAKYLAEDIADDKLPHWAIAVLPLIVVAVVAVTLSQRMDSVYAVVIALVIACLLVIALNFKRLLPQLNKVISDGLYTGFTPLIAASSLIGFGAVVQKTAGFQSIVDFTVNMQMNPYLSAFVSTNILVGVVGSSTGGLTIFMQAFADKYIAAGASPALLHRISAMASIGLDSLPHNAGIMGMISAMQLTYKKAYKHTFFVTVVITIIGAFAATLIALLI